jgi:hypothetical protein
LLRNAPRFCVNAPTGAGLVVAREVSALVSRCHSRQAVALALQTRRPNQFRVNYLNLILAPHCRGFFWCDMAETIRLRVEVEDDTIIVTLPGTNLRVIYRKTKYSQLVTDDFRGDKDR